MRRRRSTLLVLLLLGAVLLTILGLILVGAYVYLTWQPELAPVAPRESWPPMEAEAIVPALALRTLAGEPETATMQAALSVGELDTAYATVMFSPRVNDAARTGHLLLLARRYLAAGQESKAAACLQQVHALVVLSPLLSDVARADAALQAASIQQSLGAEDEARLSLAQAEVVAAHSLSLRPAQRSRLWQRMAEAYAALGDEEKAATARRAADAAYRQTSQPIPPLLLPGFLTELPLSEEIEELQAARQQRAATLIKQWIALEGGDVGPEVADLAEFLRREDKARLAYFDQVANTVPQLTVQAAAAWERAAWLSLKYRIARRGFGLSILPEWEENAPLIRSELNKAYETLFHLYGDEATALPDAADVDRAWVELLRAEILLGQLELYPDYPEEQLVERLQEAQGRLRATQGGYWVAFEGEKRIFTLQGAGGE